MFALKHLLNNAHRYSRYCSTKTTHPGFSFILHSRPFSSSPLEDSSSAPKTNDQNSNPKTSIPIVPVSYAVKKPENPPPPPAESRPEAQTPSAPPPETHNRPGPDLRPENVRAWTREDLRYVRDVPSISPVSYAARVAPLPEDRLATEEVEEGDVKNVQQERNDELERERRRLDADNQSMMRKVSRDEERVPFPTLIPSEEKKKEKIVYDLKEAIQFVKANAKRNFEETMEVHVKMTPELRRTDLKLSGSVLLPHGSGKKFRVLVFAEGDAAKEAQEAGAAYVGGKELVDRIKSGQENLKYDKCLATRDMMNSVLKIAKRLKRGMMPNPQNGTVTDDMSRAVTEATTKTVIFQKDKSAIVHVPVGKVTYAEDALRENIGAFVNALLQAKPAGLKKSSKFAGYVSTLHICSSMGQSVPVSMQSVSMAVDRYNKLRLQP